MSCFTNMPTYFYSGEPRIWDRINKLCVWYVKHPTAHHISHRHSTTGCINHSNKTRWSVTYDSDRERHAHEERAVMREAALAVTVACAVMAWRISDPFNWRRPRPSRKGRTRKRVSFSEADDTIIHHSLQDLTAAERRELCWTPDELREFARSTLVDAWLQDDWLEQWGS